MCVYLLENHPEFEHLPLAERHAAAFFAQERSFRHWQVWLSVIFAFAVVVGLATLAIKFTSDQQGVSGAFVGFWLGLGAITWTRYRCALPYYRQALSGHLPPDAPPQ